MADGGAKDGTTGDRKADEKVDGKADGKAGGKAGAAASGKPRRFGRTDTPSDAEVVPGGDGPRRKGPGGDKDPGRSTAHLRVQVARVVGLVFLVLAIVLAAAALCIALEANRDNSFVSFVLDAAKAVDLGVFDLDNPLKEFTKGNVETKTALVNYGLGAIFYLVVGRVLERIIRP